MSGGIRGLDQLTLIGNEVEYVIDSNCLIDPFNKYYNPDFALSSTFWEHLAELVERGQVGVLDINNERSRIGHRVISLTLGSSLRRDGSIL